MRDSCPCCFQPVPDIGLTVSLDGNAVLYQGKSVSLTALETEILAVIESAAPGWIPKARVMDGVWGRGDHPQEKTLAVHISHINRKLRDGRVPFMVVNSWYEGGGGHEYRLTAVSGL